MKLIVIIPAYNEEESLLEVIGEVPREIEGIDSVEVLVIDDGSMDRTTDMAQKAGAIVFHHKKNQGLAIAFRTGLIMALKRGADIIVNIDADGQYNGKEIPRIIKPVLDGEADVVLTDRQVLERSHMPFGKKYGNIIATHVTRFTSGFAVRDAQSGFRAFSREAALRLNILGSYTYVQETIIDAAAKRLSIVQVPCEFRARRGKSRLISNIFSYAKRAGSLIIRTYIHHRPLKVFLSLGSFIFVLGVLTGARFLYFYLSGIGTGHVQSLILSAVLLIIGFQIIILAMVADTIHSNRQFLEETLYLLKKREYEKGMKATRST